MVLFKSKVDPWLAILLVPLPVVLIGAAVSVALSEGFAASLAVWIGPAVVATIYGTLLWPIQYEVHSDILVVRFGLVRKRIALADVRKVSPSRNPLSSPALSLDRIRIDYGNHGFVLVSPGDRVGFAYAIREHAPHVEIDRRLLA